MKLQGAMATQDMVNRYGPIWAILSIRLSCIESRATENIRSAVTAVTVIVTAENIRGSRERAPAWPRVILPAEHVRVAGLSVAVVPPAEHVGLAGDHATARGIGVVTTENVPGAVRPVADTDEYDIYSRLTQLGYKHLTVNQRKKEYARGDDVDGFHEVHVNTMEGFWSAGWH